MSKKQTETGETEEKQVGPIRAVLDTVGTIVFAVLLALFIARFVAQVTIVQGASMNPTLQTGQRVIANKLIYRISEPKRGDIVLVQLPDMNEPLIKRVVGLPGEELVVYQGETTINGEVLAEPYLDPERPQNDTAQIDIPADQWFVMGDNRLNSRDSRAFGTVTEDMIVGKARVSIWPPSEIGIER